MSSALEEGYFPSPATPIRSNHLASPSPTKGLGSGGSVSSSLLASPPKNDSDHLGRHDNADHPEFDGDAAESPAVSQLKRATGFASVRVGLGSPGLSLNRDWSGKKRHSSDLPEEQDSALPSPVMPQIGMNSSYGLPTPPGTDSDIAVPPPMSRSVSGFSQKVCPVSCSVYSSLTHFRALKPPHLVRLDILAVHPRLTYPCCLIPIHPVQAATRARPACHLLLVIEKSRLSCRALAPRPQCMCWTHCLRMTSIIAGLDCRRLCDQRLPLQVVAAYPLVPIWRKMTASHARYWYHRLRRDLERFRLANRISDHPHYLLKRFLADHHIARISHTLAALTMISPWKRSKFHAPRLVRHSTIEYVKQKRRSDNPLPAGHALRALPRRQRTLAASSGGTNHTSATPIPPPLTPRPH